MFMQAVCLVQDTIIVVSLVWSSLVLLSGSMRYRGKCRHVTHVNYLFLEVHAKQNV